jgi:hypothetical protein
MITQYFEIKLMKKTKKKKTAKQTDLEIIVMKTTSELTSTVKVCTVFDVKDETNVCVKLLRIKMNLI